MYKKTMNKISRLEKTVSGQFSSLPDLTKLKFSLAKSNMITNDRIGRTADILSPKVEDNRLVDMSQSIQISKIETTTTTLACVCVCVCVCGE